MYIHICVQAHLGEILREMRDPATADIENIALGANFFFVVLSQRGDGLTINVSYQARLRVEHLHIHDFFTFFWNQVVGRFCTQPV